jgi:hypothetical protein
MYVCVCVYIYRYLAVGRCIVPSTLESRERTFLADCLLAFIESISVLFRILIEECFELCKLLV